MNQDTISSRDYFAGLAMQSYTQVWNSDISDNHRVKMLNDMVKRYGEEVIVADGIAKMAYEMADSMMKARSGQI